MLAPRVPVDFAATFEARLKGMTAAPVEAEALLYIQERLLAHKAGWEKQWPDFDLIGRLMRSIYRP